MNPRPETSQTVIDEFTKVVDSQDDKGFLKYNTTIDEAKDEDYNWELMALEETADLQKYLVKRIKELNKRIKEFKSMRRVQKYLAIATENLRLAEENYDLKQENAKLRKLLLEEKQKQ